MYESKIKQHIRTEEERARTVQVSTLTAELENSERRNLRLIKELYEETAIRARLERQQQDLARHLEDLRYLEEAEEAIDGKIVRPRRISKDRHNASESGELSVDTGPPEWDGRKTEPVATDARGNPVTAGTKPRPGSSRVRGGVK